MGFIDLLKRAFSPIQEEQQPQPAPVLQPKRQPKNEPSNSFQYIDEVERQLLQSLRQLYAGRQNELSGRLLVLWIFDDNKRGLVTNCHDRLLNTLCHTEDYRVTDVAIKAGSMPAGATTFFDGMASPW